MKKVIILDRVRVLGLEFSPDEKRVPVEVPGHVAAALISTGSALDPDAPEETPQEAPPTATGDAMDSAPTTPTRKRKAQADAGQETP